jgi:predicted O-methyltransferase YrrM
MHTASDLSTLPSANQLLRKADELLPTYQHSIEGMACATNSGGICASEMFFFYAIVRPFAPKQILESGRAQGESTLALARCFPDARIISVEFEAGTSNARIAEARLNSFKNVEMLYGDSRELLPSRLMPDNVVLIDGPKEFRALKLALRLLRTGKPCAVFLHDFPAGTPARQFVERHWPTAIFSDRPEFLERFGWLDEDHVTGDWRRTRQSTFACLPAGLPAPYFILLTRLVLARAISLAPEKCSQFFAKVLPRKHHKR